MDYQGHLSKLRVHLTRLRGRFLSWRVRLSAVRRHLSVVGGHLSTVDANLTDVNMGLTAVGIALADVDAPSSAIGTARLKVAVHPIVVNASLARVEAGLVEANIRWTNATAGQPDGRGKRGMATRCSSNF
jgi:hypothetical protein